MNAMIIRYKRNFTDRGFLLSFIFSVLLIIIALIVNFYAGAYAMDQASNPVTDIILSNTRAYDLDGIFVYGSIAFWLFVLFVMLIEPKKIPFILKSIALFILIRAVFISLTHIGPFPTQVEISSNLLEKFSSGADLFFSGHVGLPFLMALIFWDFRILRYAFIIASVLFGAVVLLAHLHYSIDVLAAFFITYTIFHISRSLFKKDVIRFNKKSVSRLC